jgi:hypothetical protein
MKQFCGTSKSMKFHEKTCQMFIKSVTFEEINPLLNPTKRNQPNLKDRFFFVVRVDTKPFTIEFTDPIDDKPGFVKITPGAAKFHEMITSMEFEDDNTIGYKFSDFENWLLKKSGYHNTCITEHHNQYSFVPVCIEHLTKHCIRNSSVERVSLEIPLTVHDPSEKQIEMFKNLKGKVKERIELFQKRDKVHNTTVAKGVLLNTFELMKTAEHKVMYGTMHFGKIRIGNDTIHVRLHEFLDGKVDFHSIDTTRYSMVWAIQDPLVYFDY